MNTHPAITYEQPLNEQIRICLRMEHLFEQMENALFDASINGSRTAISALLKMLDVLDRPDLKNQFIQINAQLASTLGQLENLPQIDSKKLQAILHQLDQYNDILQSMPKKIGDNLRNNTFLRQIRLHLNNPGGACSFSSPAYALWLQQPKERRLSDLKVWFSTFDFLKQIVETVLKLIRQSSPVRLIKAEGEHYQTAVDPSSLCQMVRVTLPLSLNIYPEMSVGKHRLSIRFRSLDHLETGAHFPSEFAFQLSLCKTKN